MKTENTELIKVIETSGVEETTANDLKQSFLPFFEQAEQWKEKAMKLVVTSEDQVEEMKQAREARLALKGIRVEADKKRKELKEDSLRKGKAIQGVYNVIEYLIAPIEKHLEEQEKFAEIQRQKQIEALKEERATELSAYNEFVPFGIDLGNMSDEDYTKLLNGAKFQHKAKIDAEKKIEQERIELERKQAILRERKDAVAHLYGFIDAASITAEMGNDDFIKVKQGAEVAKKKHEQEQEQIKIENERLKKEAEEREKKAEIERKKIESDRKSAEEKAAKERAEADEKLRAEQQAREKLEKEAAEKRAAEEAEVRRKADEEKKAALAPDKNKLLSLAALIDGISIPELKSDKAIKVANQAKELLLKTSSFIREKSNTL